MRSHRFGPRRRTAQRQQHLIGRRRGEAIEVREGRGFGDGVGRVTKHPQAVDAAMGEDVDPQMGRHH